MSFNYLFDSINNLTLISLLTCVFLGMLTGFGGGIIRDAIMGDMPMSLKQGSNYALSAFCGSFSFYLLMLINIQLAMIISIAITLTLREIVSNYGIYKKVVKNNFLRSS